MSQVREIECFYINYADPNDFNRTRRTVLVRLRTEDGVEGWGEVIAMWPEACKAAIEVINEGLKPVLLGRDATEPDVLWQAMRDHTWWYGEGGIASMAIAGLDMALWDVRGKLAGKPLYELFGGLAHDRLPACASCHVNKATQAERVAEISSFLEQGYQSCKLGFGKHGDSDIADDPDKLVEFVGALRSELGTGPEILVDIGNGIRWDAGTAADVANRLYDLGVGWIEEPLYPTDDAGYAVLKSQTKLPIASGEREFTATGYRRLIEAGNVDVFGIDPARVEGITGFRAIDQMIGRAGKTTNAHAWSSAILSAASLHLSLASANTRLFEFKPFKVVVQTDLVEDPISQAQGWALPNSRPGLGIDVDMSVVHALRAD